MRTKKFRQLQILRAIAAAFVVLDHSIVDAWPNSIQLRYLAWSLGDLGVGMFFVISGFIMVHVSDSEFGKSGASVRFTIRRIERIVPLYWFATIVSVLIFSISRTQYKIISVRQFIESLFFIPYQDNNGLMRPIHSVGWTLNYEIFFYMCFAIFLLVNNKIIAVYGISSLFGIFVVLGALTQGPSWGTDPTNIWEFLTFPIILLFVGGMIFRLNLDKLKLQRGLNNSAIIMMIIPMMIVALFCIFVKNYPVGIAWRFFVWAGCISAVVGTVIFEKADLQPNTVNRWLERLGDASYSTYLFHSFALILVKEVERKIGLGGWKVFIVYFMIAHICGYIAHILLEKPILITFHNRRRAVLRGA